jgi:hypothetical protein
LPTAGIFTGRRTPFASMAGRHGTRATVVNLRRLF